MHAKSRKVDVMEFGLKQGFHPMHEKCTQQTQQMLENYRTNAADATVKMQG